MKSRHAVLAAGAVAATCLIAQAAAVYVVYVGQWAVG